MPTPTNRLPQARVLFGRQHLRYALAKVQHTKETAARYADTEIPTASHAPALWVVRLVRSTIKTRQKMEMQMLLRQLGMTWRVGQMTVVKNTEFNNSILLRMVRITEVKPLRIREMPELPLDKRLTVLNSNDEFITAPLQKSRRLLEVERMYAEKLAKDKVEHTPPPMPGVGRSHLELDV